ncbi:MAG: cardiolipin synthase [Rhodospirillaceae bacterium]|nr:cardiolipin synthase [Rhodospirillaceae bacterium]
MSIALALLATLSACASVPKVDGIIDKASSSTTGENLVGARGPLSEAQSQAILVRLQKQAKDTDLLERHLAVEQAVSATPLVTGNQTAILRDGAETFRAMYRAMRGARHHINLEYYILEDIEQDHERLSDLLTAKQQAGVAVNIIYDSYGSMGTPKAFFDRLRKAGIALLEFNPINPLDARDSYSLNERDHRKILIVDGTTAIVGGVNLSSTYEHPLGSLVGSDGSSSDYWRDTDLRIQGPAVAELQKLFLQHWAKQKGPPLNQASFFPTVPASGKQVVHIIGSEHDDTIPRYYATLLSAIRNAQKNIWVTTGYFVPTRDEVEDLIRAARRGVDVRLLLPGKSDSPLALAVGHSRYENLLEAGVKIYETQHEVLHSKTAVIDGVWSVVGSSNFDHRSTLFNDEVDAVVLGVESAMQMEAMFLDDLRNAKAIDLKTWVNRPLGEKIDETYSRLWQTLL